MDYREQTLVVYCSLLSLRYSFPSMRVSILSLFSVFVAFFLCGYSDCAAAAIPPANQMAAIVFHNASDSTTYTRDPIFRSRVDKLRVESSPNARIVYFLNQTEIKQYLRDSKFREEVDQTRPQGAAIISDVVRLDLDRSGVKDISILAGLVHLQWLDLSNQLK